MGSKVTKQKKSKTAVPTVPNLKRALSFRQQRFVEEYIIDLNSTQAAIRSGYSRKNADKLGSRLVGKSRVREKIQALLRERSERNKLRADQAIEEARVIAFANLGSFVSISENGDFLINVHKANEAVGSKIIKSLEFQVTERGIFKKICMHNKLAALELLLKHMGISL